MRKFISSLLSLGGSLLLVLMLAVSCSKGEIIAHDLDEREANEILVFLSGRGIEATKEKAEGDATGGGGGAAKWNISVSAERRREAMSILSQAGLPRRQGQNLLDLFKESGLVPSELQQQIRYQSGLSAQIASIIRKMDGVIDAEVQLSFPKEDPLNPNAKKGDVTASVYVKHTGVLSDPNSHLISSIKWLVAGAVPDLSFDNVTVVPDLARYRDASAGSGLDDGLRSGDKPLVSVWTLVIAKESVTRFRIIFFSFFVSVLLLLTFLLLLIWKILPVLQAAGSSLFSLRRIDVAALTKKEEAKTDEKVKKKKKKKKEEDEDDEEENEEDDDEDEEDDEE